MKTKKILPVLVIAALLAPLVVAAGKGKWEKDGYKNGVSVYTRTVDGSEIHEIKAVATINTSTDKVWDHLVTSKTFVKTMPDIVTSKKLEDCGETCGYWYQVLKHPPIKTRHYVLKVQWKITENDDGDNYFCLPKTSGASTDLSDVFKKAVAQLSGHSRLVNVD